MDDCDKDGRTLLREREEMVTEQIEEHITDYPEDDITDVVWEIVDGCCPIYTWEIMEIGSVFDICLRDIELGPAFDGSPCPLNYTATAIYEHLTELAHDYLDERDNND